MATMRPIPNWPRISTAIFYDDPLNAIHWLCQAFGFQVQIKIVEDGKLLHSELRFGDGLVMVAGTGASTRTPRHFAASPRAIQGYNTQNMFVYVDNVDQHYMRAHAAGARILIEPQIADYGPDHWADKQYEAEDLEGHHWWFAQRLRNPPGFR